MKPSPEDMSMTTTELEIAAAAKAVYRKYGTNLSAFWRDAFAAEAQRNGDQVEQYGVDGNCKHSIPICRRCQVTGIEAHLKEKGGIRAKFRDEVYDAALAVLCDPDVMDDPDQANTLAGLIADRSLEYLIASPAPQPALDGGGWRVGSEVNPALNTVTIYEGDRVVLSVVNQTLAHQIVADHRSAAAVLKLVAALTAIADHAERATLVQNRSIGIIKQVCVSIASDAREALTTVQGKEQG